MYVSLGVHTHIYVYMQIYTQTQCQTGDEVKWEPVVFFVLFFFNTVKCHSNNGHQDEIIID